MNQTEKVMARRNTREFIKADEISVSLVRRDFDTSAAGGKVPGSSETLDPQSFRLVPANSSIFKAISQKMEGRIPQEEWLLIGDINADIQMKDLFTHEGRRYEVTSLSTDTGYRTAAGVVDRGSSA